MPGPESVESSKADDVADLARYPPLVRPFIAAILERPDFPRQLAKLVDSLSARLTRTEAAELAHHARELAPDDYYVRYFTDDAIRRSVPAWHFRMLNDERRSRIFDQAIRNCITRDSVVLELGAGAGLLAMMAARAGARRVYAVEIEPILAATAEKIIHTNGLADKVTVVVADGGSLRGLERCDVLVHELVQEGLLGERQFNLLEHAKKHLLVPNAVYLPEHASMNGALVAEPSFEDRTRVGWQSGFDLTAMNIFARDLIWPRGPHPTAELLSEPSTVLSYRFADDFVTLPATRKISFRATRAGQVSGILGWISLGFPDGTIFDNPPDVYSFRVLKHHALTKPVRVATGDVLEVVFENSLNGMWIDGINHRLAEGGNADPNEGR